MPELVATRSLADDLADALAAVERPGGFHVAGSFDIHPPRLVVEGVGPVALPLLAAQAAALIGVAEQAPYGRGTETLVDTGVRRTWQIDAARVALTGRRWAEDLIAVVERVRAGLAVAGTIEAQPYKLLIYDAGAFFVPHRDTEKAAGMFATLVIVLPGEYSGGELVIRHRNEVATVDLRRDEPSEAAFAAFYADCVHEVRPVASGHRLALIYNLVRVGPGPLPEPPDYQRQQDHLVQLLRDWGREGTTQDATPIPNEQVPTKLVYPLEHAYTEAELGFATLKGKDAAVAQVMVPAAAAADCDLHLALLTVNEYGYAEYTGGHWKHPDLEIGEVTDAHQELHHWCRPDGQPTEMGPLPFRDDQLAPSTALDDLDDTEPEFSEATGNEGATFERFYQRAALVLWPRRQRGAVLAEGGVAASVPALVALTRRWEADGAIAGDAQWQDARDLAAAIRAAWPQNVWKREEASKAGHTVDLLATQLRLGDLAGCLDFIAGPIAAGAFGAADIPALVMVLGMAPIAPAQAALTAIIAGNVARQPGVCAELLARCVEAGIGADTAPAAAPPSALLGPAQALLAGLTADAETPPPTWQERPAPLTPAQVAAALRALAQIDAALADAALTHLLAAPDRYDMDALLLPAALLLRAVGQDPEPPAAARLRVAALAHLDARIAAPLEAPADWARPAAIACKCPHCQTLVRFLRAPTEPVWRFAAAEADRRHVTHSIERARCDLNLTTEKRGRPYTLVCRKTDASYQQRVRQRAADLEHRARLQD